MTDSSPTTTIAPMLSVRRGVEAVAFYKKAFGATELFKIEHGGSVVADPAAVHAQAVAAGAKQIWPVRNEHGWFIGRVVDLYGHHWEIGEPLVPGAGE